MKKLLLTLAVAGLAFGATATDYTISSVGTSDWKVDETAKTLTGVLTATDGTKFDVVVGQEKSTTGIASSQSADLIKWYKGYSMKITAPSGVVMKTIAMTTTGGKYCVDFSTSTATAGTVSTADPVITWTNANGVSVFEPNASTAQIRIKSLVISTEAGGVTPPTPPVTDDVKFVKATTLESGSYIFVVNEEGTLKLARPYIGTAGYGRMNIINATVDGEAVVTTEDNAFELTVDGGKVTIKNGANFYSMDTQHTTSFQFYTATEEGSYWTYEFVNGAVKFTNALNTDCFISQSKGNQGTWYTNVAPAKNPAEYNLPMLYKKMNTSGIADVDVDENAPVEFYNLQGVRVANPENGIFIRRQGNNVTKVYVK